MRKHKLIQDQTYHIFTRSIAGYVVFNNANEYNRILEVIRHYVDKNPVNSYSLKNRIKNHKPSQLNSPIVSIVAYCIMPTHIHLVLKQNTENGISRFLNTILNSYTRYFNIKHNRKGPLWEGRFKSVHIENDEYLLHLTRYIHLNPSTSNLVKDPLEWVHSSYSEYLKDPSIQNTICDINGILDINPKEYKEFVEDRISYQKELKNIKSLILE